MEDPLIPLWLKISYTAFVAVLVPIYYVKYGPANFLWFSDIALFVTVAAVWLESALLSGMMAVAVLLPEVVWNVSYFGRLLTGKQISTLPDYMFDPEKPVYLRGLSLFHVFLPVLLVWLVARLGYDPRAFPAQCILGLIVLPLTYLLTGPDRNINWVHVPARAPRVRLSPKLYLVLEIIAFIVLVYLPTHLILNALFG